MPGSASGLRFSSNANPSWYVGANQAATQLTRYWWRKVSRSHSKWLESLRSYTSPAAIRKSKHRAPSRRRRRQDCTQVYIGKWLPRSVSMRYSQLGRYNRVRTQTSALHAVLFNNQLNLSSHLPSAHRDWAVWRSNHSPLLLDSYRNYNPNQTLLLKPRKNELMQLHVSASRNCQLHISIGVNFRVEHQLRTCYDS